MSRITKAVRHHAPLRRLTVDAETAPDFEFLLTVVLDAIADGRDGTSAAEDRRLADVGATQASRSHPLTGLLVGYRISLRVIVERIREAGRAVGSPSSEVLETIDRVVGVYNSIAAAIAAGYRAAQAHRRAEERHRVEFLRALLWGTLGRADLARQALAHGVDTEREYHAVRARPAPGRTTDDLARAHGFSGRCPGGDGIGAVVHGEFLGVLADPPKGPVPGVSGIGPARRLDRIDESFRMASRALDTADRRRMSGVHQFGELGLLPAVMSDCAVSETLHRKYLAPLGDTEFAIEIIDTLRAYLMQGMNVGRTAERMFVHPNTVRYRIGRFEESTGVCLRGNPRVVFELLWALQALESQFDSSTAVAQPAVR
jgi:hypothetical protein